jgi:hypothetical protein
LNSYTTKQVGCMLGLTEHAIKSYCQRYPAIGQKIGRDWLLSEKDIEFIKTRIGKRGRPKTDSTQQEDNP